MTQENLDVGLHNLAPAPGSRKRPKVIGRGPGSGHGKTSGRGQKGQLARGQMHRPGFEGGQMPLYRRLPKRGFNNHCARELAEVQLGVLNQFENDTVVELGLLKKHKLASSRHHGFKVIAGGELSKKLVVKATAFSEVARREIEKAGGKCECIAYRTPYIRPKKVSKKAAKKAK